MGVWLRAKRRLDVVPEPDEKLMMEFWCFGEIECPEEYERMGERFRNVWFFDENNKLACTAGKFLEPEIWMSLLCEKFFEPRGYSVVGDMNIIGEGESGIFDEEIVDEYWLWRQRVAGIILNSLQEERLA